MSADKTSILRNLTAQVEKTSTGKRDAAKALTPVAGETGSSTARILPKTSVPFPNDMPQEVIEQKAAELTVIIEHLTEARDALLTLVARPVPAEVIDLDAERKAKEKAADEDFAARQERLAAEAQASLSDVLPKTEEEWVCPDHGKAVEKTSPTTQRVYIGCPDCTKFKR
jgi:hypothetical protein